MSKFISRLSERIGTSGTAKKALAESKRLCAEGRHQEAITRLTETYRATGNSAVVRELVLVRNDAVLNGTFTSPIVEWPPSVPDLFPGCAGIPEISRDQLTAAALAAGIVHHGGLIVRGLLTPDMVTKFERHVRAAFDADELHEAGKATDESLKWFSPFEGRGASQEVLGREFVRKGGGVLGADSPATMHDVLQMAEDAGVIKAIAEFLGEERPAISVKKTTLRIVPPDTYTGWHQDGAFLGKDVRTVNMWISLSECGEDAPSLDLIPHRFDEIVPTGVEGAAFDWSVSDTVAERYAGDRGIHHPNFAPGDAIFFDHMNLHRTGVRPGMTKERLAIEWWFFAPSHFPMDQIPLLA